MTMFIGRREELQHLQNIIKSKKSLIGVVYGRRRIGKSELIKKAFEKEKVMIFEGLENRPKQDQIDNFIFQLHHYSDKRVKIQKIKTWREAFMLLCKELECNPAHIALDEFQWMANYRKEIVADLKMVWDLHMSEIKGTTLILCGSIASFMINNVLKSSALYGRTDMIIHLKGFLLPDTRKMLKGKGGIEAIESQMILGGVPKYLELIRKKNSLYIALEELAFSETGYLTDEYDRIFISHFGKSPEYERIIRALAKHPYGLFRNQISEKARVDLGGGLTKQLNNLESAGFISSDTPFHKGYNSRVLKYRLSDAYLRFYFSFIMPNSKKIRSGVHKGLFATIMQGSSFSAWMGRAFEYLCMDHAGKICSILGFSGIEFSFGPYFEAHGKNKSGVQADLVFDRKDNVITLCEIKYSLTPVGMDIIKEVERKAEILRRKFKKKTIQKVLISRSKPTRNLTASGYFYRVIRPEEFF
ncbi:MAG: ATP-binding protein [Desulfobacteraceae bacterium]|nr:ATP-binding protein [Desulfobacteraceae bacterium]